MITSKCGVLFFVHLVRTSVVLNSCISACFHVFTQAALNLMVRMANMFFGAARVCFLSFSCVFTAVLFRCDELVNTAVRRIIVVLVLVRSWYVTRVS